MCGNDSHVQHFCTKMLHVNRKNERPECLYECIICYINLLDGWYRSLYNSLLQKQLVWCCMVLYSGILVPHYFIMACVSYCIVRRS